MGVPKFYRWTSERYPCLSQVVRDHQIPEFDNLYLDMNGIIHICSHPNDNDPHFRISEADIFKNIFHYIEAIFRIIKPKRNFFMAVDGVAPRAKMNQQRGRRFRTAKEAQDNIKKALQKGETLPKEDSFDSNCITPGTDFMARLNDHLQYFVNLKVSTDPLWQNCDVYLSGHDVPGEGEHKVMDFIRHQKSQAGYDPNTRHCLYGLDADLIMLGLISHEPHFSLLREEVLFGGKQSKRVSKPEETVFNLLHLSLMREYLDFEFRQLKSTLPFKYDLERVIDDWVLLVFLVGNDFIPHLPNMHINHDALPYLYAVYIETMPTLDGYLHDGGILNLERFQMFLNVLAKFDRERFEDVYADMKWLEGRTGRSVSPLKKRVRKSRGKFSHLVRQVEDDIMFPVKNPFMALADVPVQYQGSVVEQASAKDLDDSKGDEQLQALFGELGFKESDGGEDLFEMEFRQHKRAYYIEKFEVPVADEDFVSKVAYEFILAIQWNLHYYYNGIQSWSWYYPFHYSPFISDLVNIEKFDLKLDKGKPFKPFEQLLAVLPAYSRKLLPEAFQGLMTMDTSPIIDYYPTEFKTDLNGKQQDWEAVVLIPFIQEKRLLSAMAPNYVRLTDQEEELNLYGKSLKYRYSKDLTYTFPSTYPGVFNDISVCKASCTYIDMDTFHLPIKSIKKGLCDGFLFDVYFPGFATLYHIPHEVNLRKAGVRVFSYASKSNNMVINIKDKGKIDAETMIDTVGTVVYVEWPYLVEALVTGVTDGRRRFVCSEEGGTIKEEMMTDQKVESALQWMKSVRTNSLERKGIDPGEVKVLVEAKTLKGQRHVYRTKGKVTLEKEWADSISFYPFQAIIQDLKVHESAQKPNVLPLGKHFDVGSQCFIMASSYYGCAGEVVEVNEAASRVRVALKNPPEPDLSGVIKNQTKLADSYYSVASTARKVGLSNKLLLRTTGSILVDRSNKGGEASSRVNIGLKIKFAKRNREVVGYARREENGWSFSENTINVLRAYIQRFPELFEILSQISERECYNQRDLFPEEDGKGALQDVLEFLKALPCQSVNLVNCGCKYLDEKIVSGILEAVQEAKSKEHNTKPVKVFVKAHVLLKASSQIGNLVPDPSVDYHLFDRVVNIKDNIAVPLGYRGTVIGVHEVKIDENDENSPSQLSYEVVFDREFLGGLQLRCATNSAAYMTSSSLLNISFGLRKIALKGGSGSSTVRLQERAEPKAFRSSSSSPSLRNDFSSNPHRERRLSGNVAHTLTSPSGSGNCSNRLSNSGKSRGSGLEQSTFWLKGYERSPKSNPNEGAEIASKDASCKAEPANPDKSETDARYIARKLEEDFEQLVASATQNLEDKDFGGQLFEDANIDKEGAARLQELMKVKRPEKTQTKSKKGKEDTKSKESELLQKLFKGNTPVHPHGNLPVRPMMPFPLPSVWRPPTAVLAELCIIRNLPVPIYVPSMESGGAKFTVKIGKDLSFSGKICVDATERANSAADAALNVLMGVQRDAHLQSSSWTKGTNSSPHYMGQQLFGGASARMDQPGVEHWMQVPPAVMQQGSSVQPVQPHLLYGRVPVSNYPRHGSPVAQPLPFNMARSPGQFPQQRMQLGAAYVKPENISPQHQALLENLGTLDLQIQSKAAITDTNATKETSEIDKAPPIEPAFVPLSDVMKFIEKDAGMTKESEHQIENVEETGEKSSYTHVPKNEKDGSKRAKKDKTNKAKVLAPNFFNAKNE